MAPAPPLRPAAFHILVVLAPGPLHGLGIAQAVDAATHGEVTLGPGTLYRSLKELAATGLIAESPQEGDDPRRRSYVVTAEGRAAARQEAERLARIVEVARQNRVIPGMP